MAPIGGGTFSVQNKILPGAYINFVSLGNIARLGTRGVVTLPLELNWGPENQIFTLDAAEYYKSSLKRLAYDPTAPELLLVREALKRANTLLAYRVNSGGIKATAQIGGMTVSAKWSGTRGNDLQVAIVANADDENENEKLDVITYLDQMELDRQTVLAAEGSSQLKDNDWVSFGAADEISSAAAASLSGGSNGTVDSTAYAAYLEAVEVEPFNVIAYPGTDTSLKELFASFVKRLRSAEGKKVVGVLYQHSGDDIGLISVKNGVVLTDGTILSGDMAVAWVAGASADASINQSLTNIAYDGAVDVDNKYTKSDFEKAIQAGEFVFYADHGRARVLSDINSLTTFGNGVSEDWTSNRVVRVMDGWANDVARIFSDSYIGLVTNSDTGRQLFKADLVSLGVQYQGIDAISNFDSADIEIEQGSGKRDVVVNCALQPNDSMEKLYMTVTVN